MIRARYAPFICLYVFETALWLYMDIHGYQLFVTIWYVTAIFAFTTIVGAIGIGYVIVAVKEYLSSSVPPSSLSSIFIQMVVFIPFSFGLGVPAMVGLILSGRPYILLTDNLYGEAWLETAILTWATLMSVYFAVWGTTGTGTLREDSSAADS